MTVMMMSNPAMRLLADTAQWDGQANVQVLEGGDGLLAHILAARSGDVQVRSVTRDEREFVAAQKVLAHVPNAQASEAGFALPDGEADVVVLPIPKGRYLSRALLVSAWSALRQGGVLYLAGPSKVGAKSVINDARSLFGNAEVLGYKSRQRVARCVKQIAEAGSPAWATEPGVAVGTYGQFIIDAPHGELVFHTRPGVFSWDGLDDGTALLLEHLDVEPEQRVWDVGCGCGVIGLWAGSLGADVLMSDVDRVALTCARKNAVDNGLDDRVEVIASDGLKVDRPERFDRVVSNPAFHQGHEKDTQMADEMIAAAKRVLVPGGRLLIVANRFLPYAKAMTYAGFEVETLVDTRRFRVLEGRR